MLGGGCPVGDPFGGAVCWGGAFYLFGVAIHDSYLKEADLEIFVGFEIWDPLALSF